MDMKL